MDRKTGGIIGTLASIIAAILIAYILAVIGLDGVEAAFQQPALSIMILLLLSGLTALYGYIYYTEESYKYMRFLSPLALALAGAGVAVGVYDWLAGGALIVLGYIVEFIVGYHLAKDFARDSPEGAKFFLIGVSVYMLGLPFIILSKYAAFVSLAGDLVKLYGLILVLEGISESQ